MTTSRRLPEYPLADVYDGEDYRCPLCNSVAVLLRDGTLKCTNSYDCGLWFAVRKNKKEEQD